MYFETEGSKQFCGRPNNTIFIKIHKSIFLPKLYIFTKNKIKGVVRPQVLILCKYQGNLQKVVRRNLCVRRYVTSVPSLDNLGFCILKFQISEIFAFGKLRLI